MNFALMNCGTFHAIFISFVNVEIRHLQMAVIQIVHQEIGISSYLVALIIETTFHHHLTLDIAGRMQWQRAIISPVAILIPLLIASYIPEINFT